MNHIIEMFIKIFTVQVIRYCVIAGVPFVVCYLLLSKWLSKAKIQTKKATSVDFWREILHSMQTTVVFTIVGIIIFYTPLKQYTHVYTRISDYPIWWFWLSVVISFVLHDTYFYWMHRLLHHPKLFRLAHLLHHKSTNPSPWTSYSFHFFEACTEAVILFLVVFIMPVHPLNILLFTVGGFMINVYGHLGYEILPKRFIKSPLFKFLNTSVYHNQHHKKFNGNYSLYFRFWDRLMGTECPDYEQEFKRVQQNRFSSKVETDTTQLSPSILNNHLVID